MIPDIEDSVVTIDAAGCQKYIAAKIIKDKGDYGLALKGNQGKLHRAIIDYVTKHMESDFRDVVARQHVERIKGHGRIDEVTYYQLVVPKDLAARTDWRGLRTIGVAIRHSKTSPGETNGVRFYISSLKLNEKRFAACVHDHWGIENTPH